MRFVIVIGTPWRSGGNYVLYHADKALTSLGQEVSYLMIDAPAQLFWSREYPTTKIISESDVRKDDVLIVPEEFLFMVAQLANRTTNYVVINQGFFATYNSEFGRKNNYFTVNQIYKNALAVLCNSEHTEISVKNWLEVPQEKLLRYVVHIEDYFKPGIKKNKITYMSRKNFQFCMFVINYLEGRYQNWEFEDIKGATKEEVAHSMSTSKIFLAFGGPEGLGSPPIEAALSGNKVIGFDGYGGKEYFNEPIFTEVPYGNHYAYLLKTTEQLPLWENRSILDDEACVRQMDEIRKYYSEENTINSFRELIRRIDGKIYKH